MTKFQELLNAAVENNEEVEKISDFINTEEGKKIEINTDDVENIIKLYKTDRKIKVMQLVGDLARVEANRTLLTNEVLLQDMIQNIASDQPEKTLQAIRCVCNICAENEPAKSIFSSYEGVTNLLKKAENILDQDQEQWNNLICPACSCIQNLVVDSEKLQSEFLGQNVLNILWRYISKFHDKDSKVAGAVLSGLSSLAENESGLQKLYDSGVLKLIIELLNVASDEVIKLIFENLLKEVSGEENARILLHKCDFVPQITKIIESKANFKEVEVNESTKEMADFIVLLTSGEDSFNDLKKSDPDFVKRFSNWIESPNKHIQISAGLALGNYARDEETCNDIVRSGIHENLINVMTEQLNNEDFNDRIQAYASCLRNLCIPVQNKMLLYKAGLHNLAVSYVVGSQSLPVQFKALAILRLLVQDNVELSTALCMNKELVNKVVELTKTSVVSSVPAESQRLLAAIIKYSSAEVPIRSVLSCNALEGILDLLLSDHTIMQSEGLIAVIITAANINDCVELFKEQQCIEKVLKLLKKPEVQAQTCFNGLTCIQAILGLGGGKDLLVMNGVDEVLDKLQNHPEQIIQSKTNETRELIASL